MGHTIFSFLITTTGMIAMLYLAYLYIRYKLNGKPISMPLAEHQNQQQQTLSIESVLNLEPRKRLYVVRSGAERFLLSSTMDKVELVSALESIPEVMPATFDRSLERTMTMASPTVTGWKERMQMSLKLVLMDRLAGWKGK